jgi:hypothetical protein
MLHEVCRKSALYSQARTCVLDTVSLNGAYSKNFMPKLKHVLEIVQLILQKGESTPARICHIFK